MSVPLREYLLRRYLGKRYMLSSLTKERIVRVIHEFQAGRLINGTVTTRFPRTTVETKLLSSPVKQ